jgi:hypothetical protein
VFRSSQSSSGGSISLQLVTCRCLQRRAFSALSSQTFHLIWYDAPSSGRLSRFDERSSFSRRKRHVGWAAHKMPVLLPFLSLNILLFLSPSKPFVGSISSLACQTFPDARLDSFMREIVSYASQAPLNDLKLPSGRERWICPDSR